MLGSSTAQSSIPNANSISMSAIASAEWNQNIFNPPYLTVAGNGTRIANGTQTGLTVTDAPANKVKSGFTTKYFTYLKTNNDNSVYYNPTGLSALSAHKIVFYVKTDTSYGTVINAFAKSGSLGVSTVGDSYGATSVEVNSFSWTKVELYVGSGATSFNFGITASVRLTRASDDPGSVNIYFTEPEVYQTTQFDYRYHSLWPTSAPFESFRPGESYIGPGNANITYDTDVNFRRIKTKLKEGDPVSGGYYGQRYMTCSNVMYAPRVATFKNQIDPLIKHGMLSDLSPYKYFVSDTTSKIISAIWKPTIATNKIVLKFQTIVATPTVNITVKNDSGQSYSVSAQTPNSRGVLILYWTGSSWTTSKWSSMPKFNKVTGAFSQYISVSSIMVEQTNSTINNVTNSSYTSVGMTSDQQAEFTRMHLIEVSPRLEIDVTDFIKSFSINKSISSSSDFLPISSIDSNDASLTLSSIPARTAINGPVPIFSNENNASPNVLTGMLGKNIKVHLAYKVNYVAVPGQVSQLNEYIQGGVFYTNSIQESDADTVTLQMLDITKQLQVRPVPDYVAQYKTSLEVITDILDFAGFSDYDYDSLYTVTKNPMIPMDLAFYFCNSKEQTVFEALRDIFLAYQVGAYVDEFGVIQFTSLVDILQSSDTDIAIDESNIQQGGFELNTKQKPGKISIRYQTPRIKQSASVTNVTNQKIIDSPSYILTTSNDVLWQQQSADSVGFNYLAQDMSSETADKYYIVAGDITDIFHTFSIDHTGYAIIEGEVVSFADKEFTIWTDTTTAEIVYVKTNTELQGKISDYVKKNTISRQDIYVTPGSLPSKDRNIVTKMAIVNVQRGLFGTKPRPHNIIGVTISTKGLSSSNVLNTTSSISGAGTVVGNRGRLQITAT